MVSHFASNSSVEFMKTRQGRVFTEQRMNAIIKTIIQIDYVSFPFCTGYKYQQQKRSKMMKLEVSIDDARTFKNESIQAKQCLQLLHE